MIVFWSMRRKTLAIVIASGLMAVAPHVSSVQAEGPSPQPSPNPSPSPLPPRPSPFAPNETLSPQANTDMDVLVAQYKYLMELYCTYEKAKACGSAEDIKKAGETYNAAYADFYKTLYEFLRAYDAKLQNYDVPPKSNSSREQTKFVSKEKNIMLKLIEKEAHVPPCEVACPKDGSVKETPSSHPQPDAGDDTPFGIDIGIGLGGGHSDHHGDHWGHDKHHGDKVKSGEDEKNGHSKDRGYSKPNTSEDKSDRIDEPPPPPQD